MQLDFSAALDRVSHSGMLFKLRDAGISDPILAVLGDFFIERTQIVKLDGARISVVNILFPFISGTLYPCLRMH